MGSLRGPPPTMDSLSQIGKVVVMAKSFIRNIPAREQGETFFSNRVIDPWNVLSEDIVQSSSVAEFKRKLFKFDLKIICKGLNFSRSMY